MDRKPNGGLWSRRDVLKTGAAIPAAAAASPWLAAASAAGGTMETRPLGGTGVNLTCLTLGCGHLRSQIMSLEKAGELVDRALALGVRSIDTAPNYSDAEDLLGEILGDRRKELFLATKNEEAGKGGAWKLLETSLKRLKTDRVDLVYIHNFGFEERFPDAAAALGKDGVLGALAEAKEQGLVGRIGISGHLYPSRFALALEREEIEVYMCAVNFAARHMYDFEGKVFEPARKNNRGLIAMKVLGGNSNWEAGTARLAGEHLKTSIRYALGLPGVCSANIGVRSVAELEEVARCVNEHKPFSEEERREVDELGRRVAKAHMDATGRPYYGGPVA